jgi:hypothetical protein
MNDMVPVRHGGADLDAYRASTEAANLCKEIVVATSSTIQGKRYVAVEGWQAIARAHGCAAGATDVARVEGGVRATGEVRDLLSGQLIATAEGFVGEDEAVWFGGTVTDKWGKTKTHEKRADYAIRAMAQTRAMSRACRSAFAHVVVMMNAGLQTTPAEEVPHEGFDRGTGEIVEIIATHEPAKREKLDGPHTSKTALKAAVTKVVRQVEAAQSLEVIEAVKAEHKRTINQARRDWPELIDGNPNVPEDIGLKGTIEKRRAELTPPERSTSYQLLVSNVEECKNNGELSAFLARHNEAIEMLDGEESREFERIYDAKAAALKSPTPLEAGLVGG